MTVSALFLTFSSSLFHKTLKSVAHIYPLDNKTQLSPKEKNEIALQERVVLHATLRDS
jgi:hypothetical protein